MLYTPPPLSAAGDHEVVVHTGNGHGSTNTMIRRFTTTMVNLGTAISYADSATLGASFTINSGGLYALYFNDRRGTTSIHVIGASLNSAELTTAVTAITVASRLGMAESGGTTSDSTATMARVVRLIAGDVIRPHTNGIQTNTDNKTMFAIRRVGA